MNLIEKFQDLNLSDVSPTSVPMQIINVRIMGDDLLGDYGRAFVDEARRVAPLVVERNKLTGEEVEAYSRYLIAKRIQCVHGDCIDFRKLKVLYVPAWIQYNLSMIGRVVLRKRGLTMMPVCNQQDIITYEQALEISTKIGALEDRLCVLQDAMPRSIDGDPDVMTTALIAGYVRSLTEVEHPVATYITAFLGMKLQEEAALQVLYRVEYDDVDFIRMVLTSQRRLYT